MSAHVTPLSTHLSPEATPASADENNSVHATPVSSHVSPAATPVSAHATPHSTAYLSPATTPLSVFLSPTATPASVDHSKDATAADQVSSEQVFAYAMEIKAAFDDGFQLSDIVLVTERAVELAEGFENMPGAEKKELAKSVIYKVIDETDGPGPDFLIDPILKLVVSFTIDKIVEKVKEQAAHV